MQRGHKIFHRSQAYRDNFDHTFGKRAADQHLSEDYKEDQEEFNFKCRGIEVHPGTFSGCSGKGGDCPECGK